MHPSRKGCFICFYDAIFNHKVNIENSIWISKRTKTHADIRLWTEPPDNTECNKRNNNTRAKA